MRKLIIASLLIIVTLPVAAGTKDKGKTTLRDVQPAGTTDKKHKHLQYDLSLSTTTGKDYTCRTKENEKPKATEMVVGSDISYEISGNKGKIKLVKWKGPGLHHRPRRRHSGCHPTASRRPGGDKTEPSRRSRPPSSLSPQRLCPGPA